MAFSSVSVVASSLLLKRFRPGKADWLGKSTTLILTLIFLAFFAGFSSLSSEASRVSPTISSNTKLLDSLKTFVALSDKKINYDGAGNPKIMLAWEDHGPGEKELRQT